MIKKIKLFSALLRATSFLLAAIVLFSSVSSFNCYASDEIFSDVSRDDWFYPYITALAEAGAVNGYPDSSFKPNRLISRAEFTTLVLNTMGVDSVNTAVRAEGAVLHKGDYWAISTIIAARHYGIADYGDEHSEWDKPISRADMVKIGIKGAEELGNQEFEIKDGVTDAIADWSIIRETLEARQIMQAYSAGIIAGRNENGMFDPYGNTTRSEACVVIMRLIVPTLRIVEAT